MCRKHARLHVKPVRERMLRMKPEKKALWRMWHYAYMDAKSLFSKANEANLLTHVSEAMQKSISLTQVDGRVARNEAMQKSMSLTQADIKEACNEAGMEPSEDLRIVPIRPWQHIEKGNIRLVKTKDRAMLAKIWRHGRDAQVYEGVLDRLAGLD